MTEYWMQIVEGVRGLCYAGTILGVVGLFGSFLFWIDPDLNDGLVLRITTIISTGIILLCGIALIFVPSAEVMQALLSK